MSTSSTNHDLFTTFTRSVVSGECVGIFMYYGQQGVGRDIQLHDGQSHAFRLINCGAAWSHHTIVGA